MSRDRKAGLEGPDGNKVGRDPRKDESPGTGGAGPQTYEPGASLACPVCYLLRGNEREVRFCTATPCPAWPFRMGTSPWKKSLSNVQLAAARARAAKLNEARERARQKSSTGVVEGVPGRDGKVLRAAPGAHDKKRHPEQAGAPSKTTGSVGPAVAKEDPDAT